MNKNACTASASSFWVKTTSRKGGSDKERATRRPPFRSSSRYTLKSRLAQPSRYSPTRRLARGLRYSPIPRRQRTGRPVARVGSTGPKSQERGHSVVGARHLASGRDRV